MAPSLTPVPTLVLDSNVVLDWLVFQDPSSHALAAAIGAGRVRWIATTGMRNELEHVLTRNDILSWRADLGVVMVQWQRWAEVVEAPSAPLSHPLRCTDPDDQKFIDLALLSGATALLSRDRAVLKLAHRALRLGLRIQTAADWVPT